MDIDILELKRQFCSLSYRKKAPTEYGSIENEVASKLQGIFANRPNRIYVPPHDMIGFVLFFICGCSAQEWSDFQCPHSLFTCNQVSSHKRQFIHKFAILGEDVALIASSLMHWYGSDEVFNILRLDWRFNMEEWCLERKGLCAAMID